MATDAALKEISLKMKKNIGFADEKELTKNLYEEFNLYQIIDELPQQEVTNIKIKEIPYIQPPDLEGSKTASSILRFLKLGFIYLIRILIIRFRIN